MTMYHNIVRGMKRRSNGLDVVVTRMLPWLLLVPILLLLHQKGGVVSFFVATVVRGLLLIELRGIGASLSHLIVGLSLEVVLLRRHLVTRGGKLLLELAAGRKALVGLLIVVHVSLRYWGTVH